MFWRAIMIKRYKIEGLDCPNCAKALETKIGELDGINSAKINFVKSYIEIDSDNQEKAVRDAIALTLKLEPDATIIVDNKSKISNKGIWLDVGLLALGIVLAVLTFVVKMPAVLYWITFVISALLMGYKTYYKALNLLLKGVINENFLVTLSVIGATAVGEHQDGLMVVALYSIGKILESLALNKSKKSIEALTNIKPEYAVLVGEDGSEKKVEPSVIKVGDRLIVKAGEKVPVDGIVESGNVSLNTQSLTGESLPQLVAVGDEILSGSIVLDGVVYIKATSTYTNSTVSKILDLIENASEKKTKTETVISKMSKWYTLGVVCLAVVVWAIVWAVTGNINTAIYRGLIFLVISCPCAFAISVPLAYFSGIGNASKNGILIKGSNYLDVLAKIDLIAFDKTGTLTTGEFEIENIESCSEKHTKEDVLYLASLGEQYSNHPLAKAIVSKNEKSLEKVSGVKEEAGKGVSYKFGKNEYFVGRKNSVQKSTVVEVYENDQLIGEIKLSDGVKETSKHTIMHLKEIGVRTAMLSGDNNEIVEKVAGELDIDEAHAKLLPEDKFAWIESKKTGKQNVAYVGDGINDAPSLTLADVGISMGLNGSSASIEASDIVVANDNPEKIVEGIKISKYTRKIVWENIIASAVIKVTFLTLGAVGVTGMLSAVIADVGVTLLAILNSLRALKYNPKHNHNSHSHHHHDEECDCCK